MADFELIRAGFLDVVERFGEWTNHNVCLGEDLYTIGKEKITGAEVKLRRIVQMVADISGKSFEELRILDLACLEGLYGLELALQGAEVVGIEGREANVEKARFVKEVLGVENITFFQDDVRNLSREKYGSFDVVLCIGIFYHLDAPDVFRFMESIGEVCRGFAIVDTHVSLTAESCCTYGDKEYWGRFYKEHDPESSLEDRMKVLWSSLDNVNSFWLSRPSFYNLLGDAGFTSVYECHFPAVEKYEKMRFKKENDRSTFVAIKGEPVRFLSSPKMGDLGSKSCQEFNQLIQDS
ncbi:class I SAM-dependent methyltransferase [Ancylothrix sp. C2]|uniref:class I SAM-dependent methyltransferase n=1 Tax=Ancylothrix sp. D3o TaxID=2953691 RepID=UPI0021BA8C08|nr:class I SAM-dependent methyltransferase [Ancylothrix sp. D3o]MCT7949157.1 class I SAM-dependent methyltransferase [Ancylothrix sp. D3o]